MPDMKINTNDIKNAVKSAVKIIAEAGVYADWHNIDDKNKTIGLTYNASASRNYGNALANDNLKTDKMEKDDGESTYEVTLKGGFKCYNITDINGTEVMHYFKRYWDNKTTKVKPKGEKEQYELQMEKAEFQRFLKRFDRKVSFVIDYHQKRFEQESNHEIDTISIYPVPSSSQFNIHIAKELESYGLGGHKVQVIDPRILVKDLSTLRKDTEFIEKNKDFYNGKFAENPGTNQHLTGTVNKRLNMSLGKFQTIREFAASAVNKLNKFVKQIQDTYQTILFNSKHKGLSDSKEDLMHMVELYLSYCNLVNEAKHLTYEYEGGNKPASIKFSTRDRKTGEKKFQIIKPKEKKEGVDDSDNLSKIVDFLTPYLKKNGQRVYKLQTWEVVPFEIKSMSNGERMALRGIYNPNYKTEDEKKKFDQEIEKIKGTAFVVFDDNVSGGATLSDICLKFKELGVDNIIPITFGKMDEKWTMGGQVKLIRPINKNNEEGFNFD